MGITLSPRLFLLAVGLVQIANMASSDTIMQLHLTMGFEGNIAQSSVQSHNKTVVCVLDSWSHWRKAGGRFQLSDIDPTLCTQLMYRSAGINNQTFTLMNRDVQLAENLGWYRQVAGLGKKFPHLKVLLSVGGWSEGSKSFSKIAADYHKRNAFVQSAVGTLKQYGFHGLDFAWEYPMWELKGGTPQDRDNLPLLLQELRKELGSEYLLSITVPGDRFLARGYNVKTIANVVDQFNIRAFDFAGSWDSEAYHHAALRAPKASVYDSIKFYLDEGAPADKLVLGIPFYGRTFLLTNDPPEVSEASQVSVAASSGINQTISGGFGGLWMYEKDLMSYQEICYNITNHRSDWKTYVDNSCHVPFARSGRHWISFDNPESVELKVEYGMQMNLKGFMGWAIDTDDFRGTACGHQSDDEGVVTYPLLRTINYIIAEKSMEETTSAGDIDARFRGDNGPKDDGLDNSQNKERKNAESKSNGANQRLSKSITLTDGMITSFVICIVFNFFSD